MPSLVGEACERLRNSDAGWPPRRRVGVATWQFLPGTPAPFGGVDGLGELLEAAEETINNVRGVCWELGRYGEWGL